MTRAEALEGTRPAGTGSDAPLVLERYRLRRRLGTGGFATVWLARDERLDREVAVKILPRDRVVGGRFEREARAAARLSHPGIVTLFEAAVDDEGAYLVSELVRGSTLDALLAAGRLSDRDVVEIGIALCDALAHAHVNGVIHRDVKPSNVLVPSRAATPAQAAKLTDFGVARVLGGDSLTRTGDVIGTAAYMAPEQAQGLPAGIPADVFSLALVLYEGLTGINPVRAGTGAGAHNARRLGGHLPPLRRQRRDLPRELGQAIDLALRPRPRERGSVEELRHGLAESAGRVGDEPGVVTSPWPARTATMPRLEQPADPRARTQRNGRRQLEERDERYQCEASGDALPASGWPARALAGVAAAGLAAWLAQNVPGASPVPAAATACFAGLLIAAVPRAGWLALTLTMVTTLILHSHDAGALVLLTGALIPVLLGPGDGFAWPMAAVAPALNAIGLACAWPALAGFAPGARRRVALAVTGWLWLALSRQASSAAIRSPSLQTAVHDVLRPMLTAGVLAPAVVWGAAAILIGWARIRRAPGIEAVLLAGWAAALGLATAAGTGVGSGRALLSPEAALLGAFAGAVVTLVARRSMARLRGRMVRTRARHSRSMELR
jgi:eukaryotic-like serine/threonine-protein kinase